MTKLLTHADMRRLRLPEGTADELRALSARYQRLYDDLNADCFGGALPECTVVAVRWTDLSRRRGGPLAGYCDYWQQRVDISDWLAGEWSGRIERVLLHEICHFRVLGHGDDF